MAFVRMFNLLLLVFLTSEISTTDVTVKTSIGYLIGDTRDVELNGDVVTLAKFLGVPYAEPPVGRNRFRKPVPKRPFAEPLIVQEFGNRCLEATPPDNAINSEDCLFLNIYVPEKINQESLAVMVYIHGGSFESGSGQDYYSDVLSAFGKTVIVTVNYRLGVWGFLRTDQRFSPGNYGLWDQRLAIQWVYDNIEAFGGDKDRITIFGESAGAASVIHQALYPENKGLFQRVIAQSGSATSWFAINQTPIENAEKLSNATGCYNESAFETVQCLRSLSVDVIQDAAQRLSPGTVILFSPSVDNTFITCNPEDVLNLTVRSSAYEASREAFASIDLLIGINSMEGAEALVYPAFGFADPETFMPTKTHFEDVMVPALVRAVYGSQLDAETHQAVSDKIVEYYDPANPMAVRDAYVSMHTDSTYLAPMHSTVNAHAKLSRRRSYMYYFNVEPLFHVLPTPSWVKGANHADEILFVFPSEVYPFDPKEIQLAFSMVGWWTNFAKTGDPNLPAVVGVTWEQYNDTNRLYLDITQDMTPASSSKEGLLESRADLWNTDLTEIIDSQPGRCRYTPNTSGAPTVSNPEWLSLSALLAIALALTL